MILDLKTRILPVGPCYGLNLISPKYMSKSQPPESQNVALFGGRVTAGVVSQDEVGPDPIWLVSL